MRTSPIVKRLEGNETRQVTETFLASEAIAAGDLVALDLSKTPDGDKGLYAIKASTGGVPVGFALRAAGAGDKLDVCVRGICEGNIALGVLAGNPLGVSGAAGVAGVVTVGAIAFALEDETAGSTVYVR